MLRKVLLPQPDGPTSETKVCPSISKLTSVMAVTGLWPLPRGGKTLLTLRASSRLKPVPPWTTQQPRLTAVSNATTSPGSRQVGLDRRHRHDFGGNGAPVSTNTPPSLLVLLCASRVEDKTEE